MAFFYVFMLFIESVPELLLADRRVDKVHSLILASFGRTGRT